MLLHPTSRRLRKAYQQKAAWKKQNFSLSVDFDFQSTPIYIISFNRLSYVKQMVEWLEKFKFTNINIIDNNSSYPPLIQYLKSINHKVHYMEKNYGHKVFWVSGKFDDVIKSSCYIVSDPDIAANDNLDPEFIKEFYRLLGEYPNITKVGFALEKNNLPENEENKIVRKWEAQFWEHRIDDRLEIYRANIDTTFALYRRGKLKTDTPVFYSAIRIAGDFTAKHLPWYKWNSFTEEDQYYFDHANSKTASWLKNIAHYKKKFN